jgi:hypothetical protein
MPAAKFKPSVETVEEYEKKSKGFEYSKKK